MADVFEQGRAKKRPEPVWIVAGLALVLTVALLAVVSFRLGRWGREATRPVTPEPEFYTPEDRWEYWRGFDATALAAVVTQVYPDADQTILAEGADENFITLRVNTPEQPLRLHFSLRSANMTFRGGFSGYERGFAYTGRVYERVDEPRELATLYGGHLTELGCQVETALRKDIDGDGEEEFLYIVRDMVGTWLDGGDGTRQELEACQALRSRNACVYLDIQGSTLYVQSFCLTQTPQPVADAVWDNGMLHLLWGTQVTRLFVAEPELNKPTYTPQELERLTARFRTFLESRGYTDVRMTMAEVSQRQGQELVCVYHDGQDYTVQVCTASGGRMHTLYARQGSDGAVFLMDRGNGMNLLDYSQRVSGIDHSLSYSYRMLSFDQTDNLLLWEENELWVAADQGGGQEGVAFFGRIQDLLKKARVCYDPYAITGIRQMEDGMAAQAGAIRPLHITNCSTNKVGIVSLNDPSSWLMLRTGPSLEHDPVQMDPDDEDSRVKQIQGSLVMVTAPHNTGNHANPTWLEVNIIYQNQTVSGYSSQKYIQVQGIRRLRPGQQFRVEVDDLTASLSWTSSDEKILSIDEKGMMTAHRRGMVLITVRTEDGREDSCLIQVE